MKTNMLYAFAASALLMLGACHKTYNCTFKPSSGIVNGQVKAISKSKAQDRCNKNCNSGEATVTLS